MRCSSAGVSSANCISGGLVVKSVEPGRDMRRSAFDGEPSCGEGVSGEGVSNLDGGALYDDEVGRPPPSGLVFRDCPPKADRNDSTTNARDISDIL